MTGNESKAVLLHRLQVCDFILVELNEYLDTHPDDQEALKSFEKHKNMREETAKNCTEHCGPVTAIDSANMTRWAWIEEPWPWEMKAQGRA